MPALQMHDLDNVATIFEDGVGLGAVLEILDKKGRKTQLTAQFAIPYGQKLALKAISAGEPIIKYGEVIGLATAAIRAGDHVHIHNLESRRGRGDLNDEI